MSGVQLTVGVELLGQHLNTFLFGLVTYQFIVYYTSTPRLKDPWIIQIGVGVLACIDLIQTASGVWSSWNECVENYGKPETLARVTWIIPMTACSTATVAFMSQLFLTYRAYRLLNARVLCAFIVTLSTCSLVFGWVAGVRSGIVAEVSQFGVLEPLVICWLTFQTAADVIITCTLSYSFFHYRTGSRKTNSVLNRLMRGAIQTGFFVSLFALGDLFSFVFARDTSLYAMFAYPMGRIYTNTLLDILNVRASLKIGGSVIELDAPSNQQSIQFRVTASQPTTEVHVSTQLETTLDDSNKDEPPERKLRMHV